MNGAVAINKQGVDIFQHRIEAILNGPEYFKCDKTHTRMKKAECVKRQKGIRRPLGNGHTWQDVPPECVGCEQGEEIGRRLSQIHPVKSPRLAGGAPQSGAFNRVDADSRKDRASRRKEEVREMEGEKNSQKTVQTCDECESTDIKARGKCSLHYNRWYMRERARAEGKTLAERGIQLGAPLPEEIEAQRKMIILNFAEYADTLEELENLAREELRPVEMQAMFLIKEGLKSAE